MRNKATMATITAMETATRMATVMEAMEITGDGVTETLIQVPDTQDNSGLKEDAFMKGNYEQPIIKTSSDVYFEQVYAGRGSGGRPGGGGFNPAS